MPTHRDVDQTIAFGQECELVAVAVRDDGSDPGVARLIILFKVLLVEVVEGPIVPAELDWLLIWIVELEFIFRCIVCILVGLGFGFACVEGCKDW